MVSRLAPLLLLLLLAACHPASDLASSRLAGKWKHRLQYTKEAEAQIGSRGEDPAPSLAAIGVSLRKHAPDDCEAFLADGTWFLNSTRLPPDDGSRPAQDMTDRGTWVLIEECDDRALITIPGNEQFDDWHRTFVFETRDTIREVGGNFDGMQYDRITTK